MICNSLEKSYGLVIRSRNCKAMVEEKLRKVFLGIQMVKCLDLFVLKLMYHRYLDQLSV